jgi:hypothetical protein
MRGLLAGLIAVGLASAAAAATPPITVDGWGDLKIGMPEKEAVRRLAMKPVNVLPDEDSSSCKEFQPAGRPGMVVMTINGRVSRVSLYEKSPLKTDRGFTIGDREADIRKAYGPALKVEPHAYDGPPAHYLTFWTKPGKRGIRYETDAKGRVSTIHAGGPQIEYIEGCL